MSTYATSSPPHFNKSKFVKYVKTIGREYRYQAITLISICRTFTQATEQTRSSYNDLRSVLKVVDDALYSVLEARKKTTKDTVVKFKRAADALDDYEMKYYSEKTSMYRMSEAVVRDMSASTVLKRLKETSRPLKDEPTMIVKFLLHKSLPDKNPTIVIQALSSRSRLTEILWNFSRFKDGSRLSLKGNPHFYEKLPTSAEKYVGQFQADPADTILQETISVLTDNPGLTGRVFLEIAKVKRVFVNVWVPKEAIIFKDICGKLEGETIVGSYLANTPNLWCFEEPPLPNDPWPSLPDRSSPPLTPVATRITSPTGALLMDWREPILRMLRSQGIGINIRISDRLPTRFSYGYSGHPLPSPLPSDSISIIGGLSPTPQSRPSLGMQIPGASRGPQYPSSYETVPSIPLTARPLEVETSPSSPSSLSSLSRETPTPMGTSIAAPPTGPAVPDYSIPDTPTLSSRGASLVDLITSQSDTDSILTSPTSTITSPTRRSRPTIGIQIPGAPQRPQYPSSYEPVRSTPLTARPPAVEMSPTSPSSSLSSLFPETPTPTGTGNATALTSQALLDYLALDTPTLSLREPSLVDVIPSQSDTYSISTSPTSTISSPW